MTANARPTFTWLGHATLRIDLPTGEVVVVDPFLTGCPWVPAEAATFERVDLLLATHGHTDHILDLVPLAKRFDPLVIGIYDLCQWFASRGVQKLSGMNLGGTQEALGLSITMVRADHSSVVEHEGTLVPAGSAAGYMVRMPGGFTFYLAGDTALFSDMELLGEIHRPTVGFLPIGDHFTMGPRDAARAAKLLGLRAVVPIHWGSFPLLTGRPSQLARELAAIDCAAEVVALEPGQSWTPET